MQNATYSFTATLNDGATGGSIILEEHIWHDELHATAIAVSGDGNTIAAADSEGMYAWTYDTEGNRTAKVHFVGLTEGRRRAAANHTNRNPKVDMFALSKDGRFLATSFTDGTLWVFEVSKVGSESRRMIKSIYPLFDYVRYEGGFSGDLLAFSTTDGTFENRSYFYVVDVENTRIEDIEHVWRAFTQYGVIVNSDDIIVSSGNNLDWYDTERDTTAKRISTEPYMLSDSNTWGFSVGDRIYMIKATYGYCVFFRSER